MAGEQMWIPIVLEDFLKDFEGFEAEVFDFTHFF